MRTRSSGVKVGALYGLGVGLVVASALSFAACTSSSEAVSADDAGPSTDEDAGAATLECPPSGVSKGPWTLAMARTSIKVRWEACRADATGGVSFHPESGGEPVSAPSTTSTFVQRETYEAPLNRASPPDFAGTYTMHEAALANLAPGTCYRYELAADRSLGGRFCTSQPYGGKVHFTAIADTNALLGNATARVLANVVPLAPDFTVHAGDIQYYDSGLETWAGWFPVMQPMLAQGALMAAIGNHEAEKPGERVDFAQRFFGDASMGGTNGYYEFETGGVHFFALDTEESIAPETPQGAWLLARLSEATKQPGYRASVLFLHRPLATCGDSAQDDGARNRYAPTFVASKLRLVVQGHMHGYERFTLDGITYVTSAGGGGRMGNVDENLSRAECAQRKAAGAFFHAMDVVIDGTKLSGRAIDEAGAVRDAFSFDVETGL